MSRALAVKVAIAPPGEVASNVCGGGSVSVGGVVSSTWIAMLALEVLRWVSVAVQVTVESPTMNVLPEGGVQVARPGPSTASVVVAVNVTAAPSGPVASAATEIGASIAGAVVSATATVKPAWARLLANPVTAQLTLVGTEREQAGRRRAGQQWGQIAVDGIGAPSRRRVATAPAAEVASTSRSCAPEMTGAVMSWMKT